MRLIDSTATFAAEVDCQFHATFVHLGILRGRAIRDTEFVLWNQ